MNKDGKKKTKKAAEKVAKPALPDEQVKAIDEDKTFDFGGLPNRDLKKNLGCG